MAEKKTAIYCRVSTEDQTLDQQRQVLVERCQKEGWGYVLFEEKVSGAKTSRTELDNLMTCIRKREINRVIVLKLDRLGRSLKHLIQLIEEFNNKQVQFICLSPEVDTTTAQGRFFLQVIGAVAELERELIRERTKAKLDYIKRQLEKHGKYKTKDGKIITKIGRPKGSKDKRQRRCSGYHVRWSQMKQKLTKLDKIESYYGDPPKL